LTLTAPKPTSADRAVFPIVPVGNASLFTTKITLVVVGTNVAGALLFAAARRRQRATTRPLAGVS
jgi:hypothetical protein